MLVEDDAILLNYCVISHVSKIHCFYFSNQTCHRQDMNPFCLHFGFPVLNVMYSLKLSNLTYISAQRPQPTQKPTGKNRGPTKPGNKIIKHHGNCATISEFELQSHYYIHFQTNTLGKGMNPLILPGMG